MRKFLEAKWKDLVMLNYEIDPHVLKPLVPTYTTIDLHEGRCFVSLVAFMFLDTRVLGFLVPGHINFEEVNLRFYVTHEAEGERRRGVVFVKEIVPKAMIAAVARNLYGEPYEKWEMANERDESSVSYSWNRDDIQNRVGVRRGVNLGVPAEGSHEEFIIEHYWGYTKRGETRTDEYRVEHPKWELFAADDPQIDVDFGATYGERFAFLGAQKPFSIVLAAGSDIAVYKGKPIRSGS